MLSGMLFVSDIYDVEIEIVSGTLAFGYILAELNGDYDITEINCNYSSSLEDIYAKMEDEIDNYPQQANITRFIYNFDEYEVDNSDHGFILHVSGRVVGLFNAELIIRRTDI